VPPALELLWRYEVHVSRCLAFVALLVLAAATATAQTTTEDGIRAAIRGDYQSAIRILRPLSEELTPPDPVAQFFLAILYETGHGVEQNSSRACGLFLSAATPANPLMQQSSALSNLLRDDFGPLASLLCVSGSRWRTVPPVTVTLAPDHRIVIAESSITVTYQGTERRLVTSGLPGAVPLPVQYTPLEVSQPMRARRHFIQSFIWVPDDPVKPWAWSLGWALGEVVGAEFHMITGERSLVVVSAPEPPAPYDVASLAHVRVNADGEAEWIIAGSANPRRAVIPWRGSR
jgi:hypothetical protein